MVHASDKVVYKLRQGSRRASAPSTAWGRDGRAGGSGLPAEAPAKAAPGGDWLTLAKIVNCQGKKPYGNCHEAVRPWKRLTVPVPTPGHDHRGRSGGKGGGRPGHNGQGVSEHIAHLVVRASVAGPVRVFSACPEKQHGRWLDIGRANDRNRLLLRKGLCCASCYRLPPQMQSPSLTWGSAI
jgi:hypothetical protein